MERYRGELVAEVKEKEAAFLVASVPLLCASAIVICGIPVFQVSERVAQGRAVRSGASLLETLT